MLFKTLSRSLSVLKLDQNIYKEIKNDNSSIYQSIFIITIAGLINVFLFKIHIAPTLTTTVPLHYIFLVWIFFNWYLFSIILNFVANQNNDKTTIKEKKIALTLVGFSNSAEILKILIIFAPNFIILISWGALMLVLASQIIGVKQIYKIEKISTSIGIVVLSYIIQIFSIIALFIFAFKLAN
tara:strand:- start:217 stop:765 length:549 start_codon:yes stop_codon:yes gene_type:complete